MRQLSSDTRIARSTGMKEVAMFKNKLQEYTQKRRLPFPAYRNVNEGLQHAPKFRATVFVDGAEYTSKSTFTHLREAEQDAARLACECIFSNSQQNGFNPMPDDNEQKSSKSILHELSFKKHGDIPKYKTIQGEREREGSLPVYVSEVTVKDKTFTGAGARNRREAEQFAARAALQSLQGTESRGTVNQMVNSKRKINGAHFKVNTHELNQKKMKKTVAEGPGDTSQVKRMVATSTPHSSNTVAKPRRPDAQRVRYGLGKGVQDTKLVNKKMQQRAPFS